MAPQHLSQGTAVTLNAAGTGQASLSPAGVDWLVVLTRISTTGTTPEPVVTLYRNVVSAAAAIEGTYSGFSDQSDTRYLLSAGDTLIAEWVGGPASAKGILRVEGLWVPAGQGAQLYGGG